MAGSLLAAVTGAARVRDGGAFDPADLGIRAIDDHTLVIELAEPVSYFIQNLAYHVLLPVPRHVVSAHGDAIGVGDLPEAVGPTVLIGGWWADYPDPDNFLRVDVELDLPAWPHEHYWEVIRRADASEDQAERLRWYAEAVRILADEAVLVPLYYQPMHYLLKPWITRWPTAAVKYPGFWKDVEVGARGGAA